MINLGIPLTFEILRCDPQLVFSLEVVSTKIKARLTVGLSYLETLIEDLFRTNCRGKGFDVCKYVIEKRLNIPSTLIKVPVNDELLIFDTISEQVRKFSVSGLDLRPDRLGSAM
jgi:hypothetical protein